MDLYYSPFACSLAAHIVCLEAKVDVRLRRMDLATKKVEDGDDLIGMNPMGQVPTLVLDDGQVMTECAPVLWFLADRDPAKTISPPTEDVARYELMKWLSFVGTEVHKKINSAIFSIGSPEAVKDYARASADRPLAILDKHLEQREVLAGSSFSIADAYLFWALTIMPFGAVSLDQYPNLLAYQARHGTRAAISAAMDFERRQFKKAFSA
jgi:glutathione S-transferase